MLSHRRLPSIGAFRGLPAVCSTQLIWQKAWYGRIPSSASFRWADCWPQPGDTRGRLWSAAVAHTLIFGLDRLVQLGRARGGVAPLGLGLSAAFAVSCAGEDVVQE